MSNNNPYRTIFKLLREIRQLLQLLLLLRKRDDFSGNATDDHQSEEKNVKRKKKKKNQESEASVGIANPSSVAKNVTDSLAETGRNINSSTRTISGGVVIEDLETGEGVVASSGKKAGRVMDGLDLEIEGMQVGGKRRLQIPPALGLAADIHPPET